MPVGDTPKIASTLELARLFATGFVFLQAPLVWERNYWLALAFAIGAIALGLIQIRVLSTRLNPDGVSQLTWRGRRHLRWDEIMTVTRKQRSITLRGAAGSVVVPIESFLDTANAVQFLNSHLPTQLRQE